MTSPIRVFLVAAADVDRAPAPPMLSGSQPARCGSNSWASPASVDAANVQPCTDHPIQAGARHPRRAFPFYTPVSEIVSPITTTRTRCTSATSRPPASSRPAMDAGSTSVFETYEILSIGQWYRPGGTIHPGDAKTLHRMGWGLVSIGGADLALGLLDDLLIDGKISPHFGDFLHDKWTAIAAEFE